MYRIVVRRADGFVIFRFPEHDLAADGKEGNNNDEENTEFRIHKLKKLG